MNDEDSILAAFVTDRGGYDVLMSPPNQGFNRLAWLFPYMVAGAALVGIVVAARRWSRAATPGHRGPGGRSGARRPSGR